MAIEIELLPCPQCGRTPKLREVGFVYGDSGTPSRYILKVECRKWFGLRRCFGPHKASIIAKDWGDLGKRNAIREWNLAVLAQLAAKAAR